jgi:hypothetical protein
MNKFNFRRGAFFEHQGGECKPKILGKKIGTLKAGGGKKIGPLARIYTPVALSKLLSTCWNRESIL